MSSIIYTYIRMTQAQRILTSASQHSLTASKNVKNVLLPWISRRPTKEEIAYNGAISTIISIAFCSLGFFQQKRCCDTNCTVKCIVSITQPAAPRRVRVGASILLRSIPGNGDMSDMVPETICRDLGSSSKGNHNRKSNIALCNRGTNDTNMI